MKSEIKERNPGLCLMLTFCQLILIHSGLSLNVYLLNDKVETIESKRLNVGGYDGRSAHILGKSVQVSADIETANFIQPDNDAVETDYSEISIAERQMTGGREGLGFAAKSPPKKTSRKKKNTEAEDEAYGNYTGPRLQNGKVTLKFMKDLLNFLRNKTSKEPPINPRDASQILKTLKIYYESIPSLVEVNVPMGQNITVVGDIHARINILIRIFQLNGLPSKTNRYLFNGDFVDNGAPDDEDHSAECALVLFGFKLLYPDSFFINRGNHEDQNQNRGGGFEKECNDFYSPEVFKEFSTVFQWLPLAHFINKKVLVIHGGLFKKTHVKLEKIKKIRRGRDPDEKKTPLMFNMMWSDPVNEDGRHYNVKRGFGISFGPDVTKSFCKRNKVEYIIRSHEPKFEGYDVQHNGQLVTVFSTADHFKENAVPNKGAIMTLQAPELEQRFTKFTIDEVKEGWSSFVSEGLKTF